MRYLSCIALLFALGVQPVDAWAGPLGGFSADETRYLVGRDTICTPVAITVSTSDATPRCRQADASVVSQMKFRRGVVEQGSRARYTASVRGRQLVIRATGTSTEKNELVSWTSFDPIARVVRVHASEYGRLIAVEYEVRFGGRLRVEVIGFSVPATAGQKSTGETEPRGGLPLGEPTEVTTSTATNTSAASQDVASTPPLSKAATKALRRARTAARKRRHKTALKAYRAVLAADAQHTEARFGVARALAYQRKHDGAVRELEALSASGRADAIQWLVEARFDKGFTRLRARADFRRATRLERTPDTRPGLYERLVGFSSTWEQPETTCENAEVRLSMKRIERSFRLSIVSRCGGYKDTTRLKGTWRLKGDDRVLLTLPNKRAKDEAMACTMQTCDGEDCLRCAVDVDLDFVLRPVRR